jgi:hypothetical protein
MNFAEVSGWGEETSEDRDVTGVAVDAGDHVYSKGAIYSEVSFRGFSGRPPRRHRCLRKFEPR